LVCISVSRLFSFLSYRKLKFKHKKTALAKLAKLPKLAKLGGFVFNALQ